MARLMYAASASPRLSSTSRRSWSSSRPIASTSASVRWANALRSVTATQGLRPGVGVRVGYGVGVRRRGRSRRRQPRRTSGCGRPRRGRRRCAGRAPSRRRAGRRSDWQMPMRQPKGSCTPTCSPASSSVVAPSTSAVRPPAPKVTVPPSPPAPSSWMEKRSTCSLPVRCWAFQARSAASSMAGGPHAHVSRSTQSGTTSPSRSSASMPIVSVNCSCRRSRSWRSGEGLQLLRGTARPARSGAEWTSTTSGIVSRRSSMRSMPITGVRPAPPVRNRTFSGGGSGSTKSPLGAARRTIVPGARPPTRCCDRKPSGIALTVMLMVSSPSVGTDVREYERQCQRPCDLHADADVLAGAVAPPTSPSPAG